MTDDDDDFVPAPPRPLQRAVPIGPAGGKTPGVQPVERTIGGSGPTPSNFVVSVAPSEHRSQRAREGWEKRRARQHLLPDRHAVGEMTVMEAVELARLIAKYPVLKKVLGA